MQLLRATNVDTSVVGWYMSTYLGTFASTSLIETQLSYQLELGDRAVVLLYDPIQTANNSGGDVVVKAYTLTKQFVEVKKRGGKEFVHSKNVFNEMTVKVRNPGLVRAGEKGAMSSAASPPPPLLNRCNLPYTSFLLRHDC